MIWILNGISNIKILTLFQLLIGCKKGNIVGIFLMQNLIIAAKEINKHLRFEFNLKIFFFCSTNKQLFWIKVFQWDDWYFYWGLKKRFYFLLMHFYYVFLSFRENVFKIIHTPKQTQKTRSCDVKSMNKKLKLSTIFVNQTQLKLVSAGKT